MSRLTITLNDELHQALKETAARQGRPIGKIIEEGLILRGIKPFKTARSLVDEARQRSRLDEAEALEIAREVTSEERRG